MTSGSQISLLESSEDQTPCTAALREGGSVSEFSSTPSPALYLDGDWMQFTESP